MTDAWEQLHDLLKGFTEETSVRHDIRVVARACDRGVELQIAKFDYTKDQFDPRRTSWQSTRPRNISTMRELAQALLDACDFVEQSNPEWAAIAWDFEESK